MMARTLTHAEARDFYDSFGVKQDLQRFYEDGAIDLMIARADLWNAAAVVEFGCGTGRLAERLLRDELPPDAAYVGIDQSTTMVELSRKRVAPWSERARIVRTDGTPVIPLDSATQDRFVSTYVLDLLSESDIRRVIDEAHRVLVPDGRLCLVGLTFGGGPVSRIATRVWTAVHSRRPELVGGCRPINAQRFLGKGWAVSHREVYSFGLCSEVLIARRSS